MSYSNLYNLELNIIKKYINDSNKELKGVSVITGSIIKMKDILNILELTFNNKKITNKKKIKIVDNLRDDLENIFKNRIYIPQTIKCKKILENTIAMTQDHLKSQ